MAERTPIIIAHRGASKLAKQENTLEAFQIAIDLKCDMAEFDIRRTKDGKLIVFHDSVIKRQPADKKGQLLAELSYNQINEIAAERNYHVPLLTEVLDLCKGKIRLDVELKEEGLSHSSVDMIRKRFGYGYDEFSIKSFIDKVSLEVKEYDKRVTTGLLVGRSKGSFTLRMSEYFPEKRLAACKADFISPHYYFITSLFMERMKKQGYPVYVWTVNDKTVMRRMFSRGVTGIITDAPDEAMEEFGRNL